MQQNAIIDSQTFDDEFEAEEDAHASQHLPAGTTLLLGQYTITGCLNCGDFGITYRALDSQGREVVIKECFPGDLAFRSGKLMGSRAPDFKEELGAIVQNFVKEAHLLAALDYDNVVQVHQIFEENDTAYMAMDFIDGRDLLDIIEAFPNLLTPQDVEQIARKVLYAIQYVHGLGVLHRDISPDNILIDKTGEPVLIDFGGARERAAHSSLYNVSKPKSVKDGYSPQESYIFGSELGASSDLYSFAASMYHVMTGHAPADAQRRLAALAAKKPDPYVPLAGNVDGYATRFLATFDKALAVLPEQRIQSADEWLILLAARRRIVPSKPIAEVRRQLPVAEVVSLPNVADLVASYRLPIAAGVAGIALLSGLGIFAAQFLRGDAADPRLALVDPASEQPLVVASLDLVSTGVSAERKATPPDDPAAPILQARPEIGTAQVLEAPMLAVDDPVLPDSPEPALRVAGIGELTKIELVSVPQIAMPEIAMTSQLISPAGFAPVPVVPVGELPSPNATRVASLDAPTAEAMPKAELVPPAFVVPAIAEIQQIDGFRPAASDQIELVMALVSDVERPGVLSDLPATASDAMFLTEMTPPPPSVRLGPLAAVQISYADWDVRMPFDADLERVRNANTAVITTVSADANLSVSGDWIAEGVILYSFNGERLEADIPLNAHVLKSLTIDPDGYARATVRYRNPAAGVLDRGLLAVPVVREFGLADGSTIEARMVAGAWALEVTAVGDTTNGLKIGDVLTSEAGTGVALNSPEALTEVLDQLVEREAGIAEVSLLRDGAALQVEWHLARARPMARK